mgnify:FL=1
MESRHARTRDGNFCPVRATLALVGQRWVPRILYELLDGKRRFNDLAATVGGCNSRTLRDRLKTLEEIGLVERHLVATMPPWVEYELTERGRQLAQAMLPLAEWGREHMQAEMLDAVEA